MVMLFLHVDIHSTEHCEQHIEREKGDIYRNYVTLVHYSRSKNFYFTTTNDEQTVSFSIQKCTLF